MSRRSNKIFNFIAVLSITIIAVAISAVAIYFVFVKNNDTIEVPSISRQDGSDNPSQNNNQNNLDNEETDENNNHNSNNNDDNNNHDNNQNHNNDDDSNSNDDNGNNNDDNSDDNDDNGDNNNLDNVINIVGFGDSISAGFAPNQTEMYDDYINYVNGTTNINQYCFTNLIANTYKDQNYEVNVKNYAVSADKTGDMISQRMQDTARYPNLDDDVQNADIITLCIGANNVFRILFDNDCYYLLRYLTTAGYDNSITSELTELFEDGVRQFIDDYSNTIVPYLTSHNAKVYVMTIFNPYKFFDGDNISVYSNQSYSILANVVKNSLANFNSLKRLALQYLDQINDYIRQYAHENLMVVDVNLAFEGLSKDEFNQYINANSDLLEIYVDSFNSLNSIANNQYFDPHPTKKGQEYLADLYLKNIQENQGE